MINYLRGQVKNLEIDNATIDVGGVGYEVLISFTTREFLETKSEVELLVFTAVREDAITLYGFSQAIEKQLFLTLIKVNGVGPKLALSILSGASVERILGLIEAEDVKGLTQLPKVGKKTAEQLILSLKGKLPKIEAPTQVKKETGTKSEIVSALVNLGFRLQDVELVVNELDEKIEIETGIRVGLKALSR